MKEFELKYGCNPNQKPAKIFMGTAAICPSKSSAADPATSTFWTHSTAGSW